MKDPKILYFTKGSISAKQASEIVKKFGKNVKFLDVSRINTASEVEKCDAVAGQIPEVYKGCKKAEDLLKPAPKKATPKVDSVGKTAKK